MQTLPMAKMAPKAQPSNATNAKKAERSANVDLQFEDVVIVLIGIEWFNVA